MVTESTRRKVALTMGTNVALGILSAVTGIILARALGPEGRGQLAAVQLWGFFLGTIAALGVPDAVVYFVAKRRGEAGIYLASASALTFLTAIAFTMAGWFIVPMLMGSQTEATKDMARIFLLVIPVFVVAGMPSNALRGAGEFSRWNIIRTLGPGLWLMVIVIALLRPPVSVSFLTNGFIAGQVVVLLVAVMIMLPRIRGPYRVEPARWGPLLRFGLPGVLSTVPSLLNLRLDQLLLVAMVSNERLGLYVAGVAWAGMIAPILASVGSVLFPRLASEADDQVRREVLARSIRYSAVVSAVLVVAVLLVTPIGLRALFGSAFGDAVPAAALLVIAGGFLAVDGVMEDACRGLGRPVEVLWAELSGLVITGGLLFALLPSLDIVGAALASLGGYATTAAVLVVRLRTSGGVERYRDLAPRPVDVAAVVRIGWGALHRSR